jgi:aspartyl-tRNA synthetase
MKFIGIDKEQAMEKFGFLLDAYTYGGPPHGGMGIGADRTIALMAGTNDIREIIAFPKNKAAECPMDGSPGDVSEQQLKELHIKTEAVKKKQDDD